MFCYQESNHGRVFRSSDFYGIRRAWAKKTDKMPEKKNGEKFLSFAEMYREWCSKNKHVAGDVELAHFSGKNPATVASARAQLVKSGFIFSTNGTGFNVVSVPEEPKYTESQWREQQEKISQIEKLLAELKK